MRRHAPREVAVSEGGRDLRIIDEIRDEDAARDLWAVCILWRVDQPTSEPEALAHSCVVRSTDDL